MHGLRVFIICCFLVLAGCEKQPFDYRNKFLGDYKFSVHYWSWSLMGPSFDTTYTSDGRIWYGSGSDAVQIKISENESFEFIVLEDGTLEPEGYSMGEFESTEIVKFYLELGSGLGGGAYYDVKGEKK